MLLLIRSPRVPVNCDQKKTWVIFRYTRALKKKRSRHEYCDQIQTSFQQGRVNNAQFELHAGCWAKQVLWELHDVFPSKAEGIPHQKRSLRPNSNLFQARESSASREKASLKSFIGEGAQVGGTWWTDKLPTVRGPKSGIWKWHRHDV